MNDSQLSRYAALESRLPEGFPRLVAHDIRQGHHGWQKGKERYLPGRLSEADRGWFAVLVLRACLAENIVDEGRFDRAVILGDQSAIADTLTDLESAYPATEGGN